MRTTLTLDDDVAARLTELQNKLGLSFKEVTNLTLRIGLEHQGERPAGQRQRFTVQPREMGIHPGLNYDNVGDLLEQLEGAAHR